MAVFLSGGCLCGVVRYEYTGELGPANYCHCQDCRRITGSAFNIGVRVQADLLRILTGKVKAFTKIANSGNTIIREFCPECGSPLFTKALLKPQFIWIKAGSLDDSGGIEPMYQIWTNSAVSWAYIPIDLPTYPGNPTVSQMEKY